MQADGKAWLFAPTGLVDGPLPAHYEAHESVVRNPIHPEVQASPTRQQFDRDDNRYNPTWGDPGAEVFPFALLTYRIAEHHTAGAMSRTLPYLAELAPDPFVEVSPELAAERGFSHGEWVTVVTSRAAIEARALVTDRIRPHDIDGRQVHTVGAPYHWGPNGLSTGDSVNDLTSLVLDQNVHISEFKVATCDLQPGRRPRGPALVDYVEGYRRRAEEAGG